MSSYCTTAPDHPFHGPYHDTEYGFPNREDAVLLERLALEIFQAGLSWEIVLKKRAATFDAFDGFAVRTVSRYDDDAVERLLANDGIIRNRLKIQSIIHNARVIDTMRPAGGFAVWLDSHHPADHAQWVKLFKKTFRFTGKEIVNEFLMSLGYLDGAHHPQCPVYGQIAVLRPPWMHSP